MEQGNEMTVTKDLFRRVGVDEQKSESVVRPSIPTGRTRSGD